MSGLHKLRGGIVKRERQAWERIAARAKCKVSSCSYDAVALVLAWDAVPQLACATHADEGEERGYTVLRDPSCAEANPGMRGRA